MHSLLPWHRLSKKETLEAKYEQLPLSEANTNFDYLSTRWKQRFYVLSIVYITTALCGIGAFLFRLNHSAREECTLPTDAIFGDIPRKSVLFTPNQRFTDAFPNSVATGGDHPTLWDALQPRGGGFIKIPNPRQYGLTGGLPVTDEDEDDRTELEGYGISMFHQIHCLVAIRKGFHSGNSTDEHMDHCFEYLRQTIMCHGDTTLEKVVTDGEGKLKPDIDGWGTTHECRSWNMLFDFAERRRVKVIGD